MTRIHVYVVTELAETLQSLQGRLIFPTECETESYYDGQWKKNKQHRTGVRRYRCM